MRAARWDWESASSGSEADDAMEAQAATDARRLHARTPARAAPDGVGTTSAAANRSSMSAANVLGLS